MNTRNNVRRAVELAIRPTAFLMLLAVGLVLTAGCGEDAQPEVTPTVRLEAQPTATLPTTDSATETLQEIVDAISATMQRPFPTREVRPLDCQDPSVQAGDLCLLLESSAISPIEARIHVALASSTAIFEVTLRNESGEWMVIEVIDLSG